MNPMRSLSFVLLSGVAFVAGCLAESDQPAADEAQAGSAPVSASDAFCPTGFSFDASNKLCLSATEAAGPFPPSMVDFCKRFVANRADGTNSCVTSDTGGVATRWSRNLAIDGRKNTLAANGCSRGTSFDASAGYCSDGANIYGPFSKDDVAFCKANGGALVCETNRVAPGFARPKVGGDAGAILARHQAQRITLWDQTFGRFDGADPLSNITDAAAGRAAKTSCYGGAPCNTVRLSNAMLAGLGTLTSRHQLFVTAIAGASHSPNSYHYAGRAVDFDEVDGTRINGDSSVARAFMAECRSLGAIEVLGPSNDAGHQDHLHCAW
jgi:hypothetical protein